MSDQDEIDLDVIRSVLRGEQHGVVCLRVLFSQPVTKDEQLRPWCAYLFRGVGRADSDAVLSVRVTEPTARQLLASGAEYLEH